MVNIIIFGASGALAQSKLFSALYEMHLKKKLKNNYKIIGFARSKLSDHEFRSLFMDSVIKYNSNYDLKIIKEMLAHISYESGQYDDENAYFKLKKLTDKNAVKLVYFAVPPFAFRDLITNLATVFGEQKDKLRLILEKPFGDSYESAKKLKKLLTSYFNEDSIYLLDHYLGKESVFNLLVLKYANSVFSYLIEGKNIKSIKITAFENEGLQGRAGYFDKVGILKDMVQSHLLQLVSFMTMSIPRRFENHLITKAKLNILNNLFYEPNNITKAQYVGYLKEPNIPVTSKTETFVAIKLGLDLPDWHNVPIFITAGKCMRKKETKIEIEFKSHLNQEKLLINSTNKLIFEVQPNEKISFNLITKKGGKEMEFLPLNIEKNIYCSGDCLLEHSRLFVDILNENKLLFLSFAEIYASWKIIDQISQDKSELEKYSCNSDCPVVF